MPRAAFVSQSEPSSIPDESLMRDFSQVHSGSGRKTYAIILIRQVTEDVRNHSTVLYVNALEHLRIFSRAALLRSAISLGTNRRTIVQFHAGDYD